MKKKSVSSIYDECIKIGLLDTERERDLPAAVVLRRHNDDGDDDESLSTYILVFHTHIILVRLASLDSLDEGSREIFTGNTNNKKKDYICCGVKNNCEIYKNVSQLLVSIDVRTNCVVVKVRRVFDTQSAADTEKSEYSKTSGSCGCSTRSGI
jgi:hypothetical protein